MSVPWQQNCPHSGDGWCVKCVTRLVDAVEAYRDSDGTRRIYNAAAMREAGERIDAALCNREPARRTGRRYGSVADLVKGEKMKVKL